MSSWPWLVVNVAEVTVVPGKPSWPESLRGKLTLIENGHRVYTGLEIVHLLDLLNLLDELLDLLNLPSTPREKSDEPDVKTKELKGQFLNSLTDAIDTFEKLEKRNSDFKDLAERLQSVADKVDRSDFGWEALVEELNKLEHKYKDITGDHIRNLVNDLKQQSDAGSEVDQKSRLSDLVTTFKNAPSNVQSIISKLKDAKKDVENAKDDEIKENRLQVEVTVENLSRHDNAVARKAMIAVSDDNDDKNVQYFELDISLSNDHKLTGYSMANKVFLSRPAHKMDIKKRDLMDKMKEDDNLKCEIVIADLHRKLWTSEKQGCKGNGTDVEDMKRAVESS